MRGEKPFQTSQPTTIRYQVSGDKKTYSGAPIPEPRIDYSAIRQAKLKCNDCKWFVFATCDRDPLTCREGATASWAERMNEKV